MKAGIDYVGVCTCFILTDGLGNIFMHKRTEKCRDEVGRWDVGSGKLEIGYTLEQNLFKELDEELNAKAKIIHKFPVMEVFRNLDGVETHWLVFYYLLIVENPEQVSIKEKDKITDGQWRHIDSLPQPLHSSFSNIIPLLREVI
jgi:ADP-ribose pyrophosphatase YjhB (NUDIX family)